MATKTVVTFGEIMTRMDIPKHGKIVQGLPGPLRCSFAGAEANVAFSLSYMGQQGRFVTALPENELGTACIHFLRGSGVDTSFIVRSRGRLGSYFVETGANQRPSKVIYDREHSAISLIKHSEFDWESIFCGASWLHCSGITPALSEQAAESTLAACRLAKQRGLTVSLDLNFRKKLWQWRAGTEAQDLARQVMPDILRYVDVLIANEEDAADVLDIHPEETDVHSGRLSQAAYVGVAQQVAARFANIQKVATTLRESISATHNNWGAMLYDIEASRAYFAPLDTVGDYAPYAIRHIIDRVGGGDAFAAGLIFALNSGEYTPEDSLRYAVAASCLCHSIQGDFNYSSKAEIELLMQGNASGRVQR